MGRFKLERLIGEGGYGRVFRATDTRTAASVALKLALGTSEDHRAAFTRELSALAALRAHDLPGVAHLIDAGEHDGHRWLATRLLTGSSLDRALHACGVPSVLAKDTVRGEVLGSDAVSSHVAGAESKFFRKQLLPVVRDLAQTLGAIHDLGYVHGDIKPSNVLLDERGTPVLIDLGNSGRIFAGDPARDAPIDALPLFATPGYQQPSNLTTRLDPRADVYAFGCILFEVLWGVPYQSRVTGRPCAPTVADAWPDEATLAQLGPWLDRLLEPDISRRPSRFDGVLDAIDTVLGHPGRRHTVQVASWTRFFGRTVELGELTALLTRVQQGESIALGIHGDRGIGKTRLANELTALARSLGFELIAPSDSQVLQTRRLGERPAVVVFDDLHPIDADPHAIFSQDAALPAATLLIVTWSDPKQVPAPWIGHRLPLHGLAREASLALAVALLNGHVASELFDALYLETDGHPTRLRKTIEYWLQSGVIHADPATGNYTFASERNRLVTRIFQTQIAQHDALSPDAKLCLELGRLIGPQCSNRDFAWLTQWPPERVDGAVEELLRAGLVSASRASGRYLNDVQAADHSTLAAYAPIETLTERYAFEVARAERVDERTYATLGRLYSLMAAAEPAFDAYHRAAEHAQTQCDRYQARVCLRLALSAAESIPDRDQRSVRRDINEARERLAELLVRAGEHTEARELYALAERDAGSETDRLRVLRKRAHSLSQGREYVAAESEFQRAEAYVARAEPVEQIELLLAKFWHCYYSRRSVSSVGRLLGQLAASVDQHGTARQRCEYHHCMAAWRLYEAGYSEDPPAIDHARAAWAIVEADGSLADRRALSLFYLGFPLLWAGGSATWQEASTQLLEAKRASGDLEDRSVACSAQLYHAVAERRLGRTESAEHAASDALGLAMEIGSPAYRGAALACLCWAAYRQERLTLARRLADQAIREWQHWQLRYPFQWLLAFPLAELHRLDGEFARAQAVLERLLSPDQHRVPEPLHRAIAGLSSLQDSGLTAGLRAIASAAARSGYL